MSFITENKEQISHTLWTERYRPTTIDNFIGNEHLKEKLKMYISTNDVPHLLLHGKPGTGKSTAAKMIANSIDCDYLFINASDENNVDTMRNKIKTFASTIGFKPMKLVILDEADYLSVTGAQPILRNMMETFSQRCRFILTCNYVDKIIEPLQSRCQTFQVIPPSKKDIAVHVSKILTNENITFEPKDIVPIIDASYPDIRKVINTLQLNSHNGKLVVDTKTILENDYKSKILDILKSKDDKRNKYHNCRQTLIDSRATDFSELYTLLYERVDEYAGDNTSNVILIIADGVAKSPLVTDKEIIAASVMIQIINTI
jgi:DNA polymerase III delta prime subunit